MSRVYIHEFVDVIGTKRSLYQHHMTANWVPEGGPLRRQRCFGVFSLVGSTGRWPQVINIWEYDSWDDLAHNFEVELSGPGHRDPMLEKWWAAAAEFRQGGFDRILVSHQDSPGIEDWQTEGGSGSVAYSHEILHCEPGSAPEVSDAAARRILEPGVKLIGAWRTAMRAHDEVIVLRGFPDWETWSRSESAADSANVEPGVLGCQRVLLVDAELSPLRIGRQPVEADRRDLDSV